MTTRCLVAGYLCVCLFVCVAEVHCDEQNNETTPIPSSFIPVLNMTECSSRTICNDVFNYPDDFVIEAFQSSMAKYQHLLGEDKLDVDVGSRFLDTEKSLCDSVPQLEEPKAGKNEDDQWMFIVNSGNYKQAVEIRVCANEDEPCRMHENFPRVTKCKQKYILRKLLALDPNNGELKQETFKLPSCCSCRFYGLKPK